MALPQVTDHALVRYLERSRGLNVEAIRREIAQACVAAVRVGSLSFKTHDGAFQFRDGAVVSFTPASRYPSVTKVRQVEASDDQRGSARVATQD